MKTTKTTNKIVSCLLSLAMVLGVLLPCSGLLAYAEDLNFPAPVEAETAKLLKEVTVPYADLPTAEISDAFAPALSGTVSQTAPVISTITSQATPDSSVVINGEGFAGGSVYIYGLNTNGQGMFKRAELLSLTDTTVTATIDSSFAYGMYFVWVRNASGEFGYPVRVNAPETTWLSNENVKQGSSVRIYGKNLSKANGTQESHIYLTNGENYYAAEVTEVNPFRVTFTVPQNIANGDYKVYLHNGHGGAYGWTNALSITVNANAESIWNDTVITVQDTTQEAIIAAIQSASDYDTIYLPAGTYDITSTINVCVGYPAPANQRKALRFVGEGDGSQVKIINKIRATASSQLFYVTKLPSEFKNITFEEDVSIFKGEENKAVLPSAFIFVNPYRNKENGFSNSGFKIDNCNFIQHRIMPFEVPAADDAEFDALLEKYNNPDAEDSRYCEGDWLDDVRIRKAQYTSYVNLGQACVIISSTDDIDIRNSNFAGYQGVALRGCNNVTISDNEMIGKVVMHGNSGSNFLHITHTNNIDISNNNIYGKDLFDDPDGDLERGDLTLCRSIVIQMPAGSVVNNYIADNYIERIGQNISNAGEHILYEDLTMAFMDKPASVTGEGGVTLSFDNTQFENRPQTFSTGTYDNWYIKIYSKVANGSTVTDAESIRYIGKAFAIIVDGKGESQYRRIIGFTENSFTVERPWDIAPDQTSTVVIMNAAENSVNYRNTVVGTTKYYLDGNASAGSQPYATLLDYIVTENNFSHMYTGVFCDLHFNNKRLTSPKEGRGTHYADIQSEGFNWLEDALIYNNVITDARKGVDLQLCYSADGDVTASSAMLSMSHGVVIRNNTLKDMRYGLQYNSAGVNVIEGIGAEGVSVGSLDKYYTNWNYNPLWQGDWIRDTLIENNKITNTVKASIGLYYHQANTMLRNNYCGGITDEARMVYYAPTRTANPPVNRAVIYKNYGTSENGITTKKANEAYDIILATVSPVNLDFTSGLKYWAPKSDKLGAASAQMRTVSDEEKGTVITTVKDTENATDTGRGITTVKFRADVKAGDKLYLLTNWKNNSTSGYDAYPTLYQWDASGNKTAVEFKELTANSKSVGKWNTKTVAAGEAASSDSTFAIEIKDVRTNAGTDSNIFFGEFRLLKQESEGIYTDIKTGEKVYADGQPVGGTEEEGIKATFYNGDMRHYGDIRYESLCEQSVFGAVDGLNNGDFSQGFKYWSIREYSPSKAPQYVSLSQQASITSDGALKLNGDITCCDEWLAANPTNTNVYAGLTSAPFTLSSVNAGDEIYLAFDMRKTNNYLRVRLYDDTSFASAGVCNYAEKYPNNNGDDMRTILLPALTVSSDDSIFFIEIQKGSNTETAELDNFRVVTKNDDGTYTDATTGELLYGDLQPFGGTEEDGIVSSRFNNGNMTSVRLDYNLTNTDYYLPTVGLKNPDFSQGFKYWSYRGYSSSKAPQYTKISQQATVDKTTGVLTFGEVSCCDTWLAANPTNTNVYAGLSSTGFTFPDVVAGNTIYATAEIRNTAGRVTLALQEHKAEAVAANLRKDAITTVFNGNGGAANTSNEWVTTQTADLTVTNNGSWFSIYIQRDNGAGTQVRNIRIYMKNSDGVIYDITHGDPIWAGTEEHGIRSTISGEGSTNNIAPTDGQINYDFSKGLKYWASTAKFDKDQASGTVDHLYASETGSIVTEANGNKYFKFDGVKRSSFCGIKTAKLSIPADKINVGDKLVVMFDYMGDKNVQIKFEQRFCTGGAASSNSMISVCTVVRAATEDNPWTTVATKPQAPVVASTATVAANQSVRDGDYVFMITAAVPSNTESTCGLDNIRLVKIDDNGNYHEIF